MSKLIRITDDVYDALKIIKVYPSTSFSDIIRGLIDHAFPGEFFDEKLVNRELLSEENQKREWV